MQSLAYRKKTSPFKSYRNEPGRFFGDGVTFKAKLIGILEVGEARGDKMCQDALQDLKMAIRAAGEHKQRIIIHVTIDGLRLRDEKTNDSLYHHPVHKISFIAQDMNDSRAFGYIFGSPDSGHRFFGIKTDKAASLVVLAMRDLFQVVFELKKKEIEIARQQIGTSHRSAPVEHLPTSLSIRNTSAHESATTSSAYAKTLNNEPKGYAPNEISPESVADLVDLEHELSSIQRGITQMERITPNEPPAKSNSSEVGGSSDPFGDSFTNFPSYNLLPPPETSKSRHSKPLKPPEEPSLATQTNTINTATTTSLASPTTLKSFNINQPKDITQSYASTQPTNTTTNTSITTTLTAYSDDPIKSAEEEWLRMTKSPSQSQTNNIDESPPSQAPIAGSYTATTANYSSDDNNTNGSTLKYVDALIESTHHSSISQATASAPSAPSHFRDAFTDLDPLGTGKIKPYIDKKYFFQDLKNPPKKILRDLSERDGVFSANFTGNITEAVSSGQDGESAVAARAHHDEIVGQAELNNINSTEFNNEIKGVDFAPNFQAAAKSKQDIFHAAVVGELIEDAIIGNNKALLVNDNDPFSPRMKKFDQFDDDFTKPGGIRDPFEFAFENGQMGNVTERFPANAGDMHKIYIDKKITDFNGPLQVNLPPESHHRRLERHGSDAGDSSTSSTSRSRPGGGVFKQNTVDNVINSISSKKMKPHLFSSQKYSKRDSNTINMRRLQESDSLSETESAPDPPPRPQGDTYQSDPPPLPPKKPFSDIHIRPRTTSPSKMLSDGTTSRYGYNANRDANADAPALPLPSRRVTRSVDQSFPGPTRPAKKTGGQPIADDDYLTPIGANEAPILLPPPQNRSFPKNRGRRHPEPNYSSSSLPPISPNAERRTRTFKSALPDITLSELLTLGIDDLASKLNVPVNRLSTMNIVELTQYLSDFIEKSSQTNNGPADRSTTTATTQPTTAFQHHNKPKSMVKEATPEAAIFKVSFDNDNDATFIAKFDDNFGETSPVPKFANFETISSELTTSNGGNVPKQHPAPQQQSSIDRYAVFREIIEQDQQVASVDEEPQNDSSCGSEEQNSDSNEEAKIAAAAAPSPPKIDNKITQVIAQAKDRYAALRDIIMVEDLFDNSAIISSASGGVAPVVAAMFSDHLDDDAPLSGLPKDMSTQSYDNESDKQTSPEINISLPMDSPQPVAEQPPITSSKDDHEINEYMNRAISNMSLDSRDHLSPIAAAVRSPLPTKSILQHHAHNHQNASTSPIRLLMPTQAAASTEPRTLAHTSTSPMPSYTMASHPADPMSISNSPMDHMLGVVSLSPRSPLPQSPSVATGTLIDDSRKRSLNSAGSLSDVVLCASSPDVEKNMEMLSDQGLTSESWAVFEAGDDVATSAAQVKNTVGVNKNAALTKNPRPTFAESPCSSDDKNDWKAVSQQEYHKRWPQGQTSSSSRDLSPWDDDAPPPLAATAAADLRRRTAHPDRHGFYMRHARRMQSGDDDYEYDQDQELTNRRDRRAHQNKAAPPPLPSLGHHSSRENFDSAADAPGWYQSHAHKSWSPAEHEETEQRAHQFDRGAYERSTYGPPYEKRDDSYERGKKYKVQLDKQRRYHRAEYARSPDYDFEMYADDEKSRKHAYYDEYESRVAKARRDYDAIGYDHSPGFGRGGAHKSAKDYFYERDKRSFDRESAESFDSFTRRRKSYGSADIYGSLDSREEYQLERSGGGPPVYVGGEKTRSLRKPPKVEQQVYQEYAQDSDGEVVIVSKDRDRRRGELDTRSLQRPPHGSVRPRKSSGSSPWDGDDLTPTSQKSWKRPSSVSESDKKFTDRRGLSHSVLPGSDGEKDRRFRKKTRSRGGKEIDSRSAYSTMRPPSNRSNDFRGYEVPDYENDDYRGSRCQLDSAMSSTTPVRTYSTIDRCTKERFDFDYENSNSVEAAREFSRSNRDVYYAANQADSFQSSFAQDAGQQANSGVPRPLSARTAATTPGPSKGNYDENEEQQGFESDFNSSSNGKQLRFSNDFSSDKERHHHANVHQALAQNQQPPPAQQLSVASMPTVDRRTPPTPSVTAAAAQKLRFDETVTVTKFDRNAEQMFDDDDFSKADFTFAHDDQWASKKGKLLPHTTTQQMLHQHDHRPSRGQQDLIKKSESVNIFAKREIDPFENDDFFNVTNEQVGGATDAHDGGCSEETRNGNGFNWDKNFAKFDDNM